MQRVELKRVVDLLRGAPKEEKAPIANGQVTDNGTIPRETPKEVPEEPTQMSLLRMLCFVFSLKVGVLYVVALAWILPCNDQPPCSLPVPWNVKFSDIVVTANIEIGGHPSLTIFGYTDEGGGYLTALETSNGKMAWNRSLEFIPRKISCDVEGSSCLVSGDKSAHAFNVSDGDSLWETVLHLSEDDSLTDAVLSPAASAVFLLSNDHLFILDAERGLKRAHLSLPCTSTLGAQLLVSSTGPNSTITSIVCEEGNRLELWTVDEEKAITSIGSFSQEELEEDPEWQQSFSDPSGRPLDVTGVVAGRFFNAGEHQVAVTLRDGSKSAVYVLNMKTGAPKGMVPWTDRWILTAKKWPSESQKLADGLILELVESSPSQKEAVNFSDPRPLPVMKSSFSAVRFTASGKVDVREAFVMDHVIDWSASPSELLILREPPNGSTEFSGRHLQREAIVCTTPGPGNLVAL